MSSSSTELLIAIDIGLLNLSLCALRCTPLQLAECGRSPPRWLVEARRRLLDAQFVRWEVVALDVPRKCSFAEKAIAVASFVKERRELFASAAVVVVEHQMQSAMRCLAAALFAAVAAVASETPARLLSQQSHEKLRWADIEECTNTPGPLGTYAARKRAAVECAYFLIDMPPPILRRGCPRALKHDRAEEEQERTNATDNSKDEMRVVLINSRKKDDLADALLHLLAYDARSSSKSMNQKRRPDTSSSSKETTTSGSSKAAKKA